MLDFISFVSHADKEAHEKRGRMFQWVLAL